MTVLKVLIKSLIINGLLVVIKLVFGFIFNSAVLVADGIHSLSDLLTDTISIIGTKFANKKEDKLHPYGHGRIEYLLCMIIGFAVLIIGGSLIKDIFNKEAHVTEMVVVVVSIVTILIKYLIANYILKVGYKIKSDLLIASGKESQADVYSSVVVLVSLLIGIYFKYAEVIGTVIISVMIMITGIKILKENVSAILGEEEHDEEIIKKTKELIKEIEEVEEIQSLRLLKFGSYYRAEVVVVVDGNMTIKESDKIVKKIKRDIIKKGENIKYVNIYVRPS